MHFFFCRKHWGNQLWDRVCITLPLAVNNKQFFQNDSTQYFSTLVLSASPRNLLKVQILIPLSRQLWGGGPAMFVVTSSLCYSDTNTRAVVPSLHSGIILKSQTNKQTNKLTNTKLPSSRSSHLIWMGYELDIRTEGGVLSLSC